MSRGPARKLTVPDINQVIYFKWKYLDGKFYRVQCDEFGRSQKNIIFQSRFRKYECL